MQPTTSVHQNVVGGKCSLVEFSERKDRTHSKMTKTHKGRNIAGNLYTLEICSNCRRWWSNKRSKIEDENTKSLGHDMLEHLKNKNLGSKNYTYISYCH